MKEVIPPHLSEKLYVVEALGEPVGKIWQELQAKYTREGLFYVSSPLSNTPLPVYQWIIDRSVSFENWNKMRFILMDEQVESVEPPFVYIPSDHPACYERFARQKLLNPLSQKLNIRLDTSVLKPELDHLETFDRIIQDHRGIDLLILAIGARGHYAQVMPATKINTGFHVARLIPEFIEAHTKNSGPYEGTKFREYGMSLGPQQVLSAKNVVVIVSGAMKRDLTKQLLAYDSFDPEFPLSIIYDPKIKDRVRIFLTKDVLR